MESRARTRGGMPLRCTSYIYIYTYTYDSAAPLRAAVLFFFFFNMLLVIGAICDF